MWERAQADGRDQRAIGMQIPPGVPTSRMPLRESAGMPGFYLRHQNFGLRPAAPRGGTLFDQDTTSCPVSRAGGSVRRSTGYPARHVRVAGHELRPEEAATVFRVEAPL
jgi:hypothetical protein